jgi:hypothetical protein
MKIRITDFLIVAIVIIPIGIFVSTGGKPPFVSDKKILEKSSIDYPSEHNYYQSGIDCGPYSVAAVVRTLTGKEVNSAKLAESIGFRLPKNKFVLPMGLEKQLKDNGLEIEVPNIRPMSDNDKLLFLQERISTGQPVIILVKKDGYRNYLTVFGFNGIKDEFYVYDSTVTVKKSDPNLTVDKNGPLPGNLTMTNNELLASWEGGGMYGIYKWYAISAWINNSNDKEDK